MIADACGYAADEVLRDGAPIHIRAIRPDDKERLLEHFHALGPRSVYYRFHATKKRLTAAELSDFTDLDFVHAVGLVALARDAGITEFEAEVLGDNSRMLHVFARCGFTITRSFDAGVVHVAFPTTEALR